MNHLFRLARNSHGSLLYREAWCHDSELYFREGEVGHRGTVEIKNVTNNIVPQIVDSFHKQAIWDGFAFVVEDDFKDLVVRLTVDGFGMLPQLTIRHELEDAINEALGWTGNGRCNGGDAGGDTQQIDCQVLLIEPAIQTISALLQAKADSFDRIEIVTADKTVVVSEKAKR